MKKSAQSIILEDAFYTIAAANGKVLEVANYNPDDGAAIQLWDYSGEPWQQWRFEAMGKDTYRIRNRFTDKAIDLALRGTVSGTLLHQWTATSGDSQQWTLEAGSRGTRIRSVRADKSLDLAEMSTANGARAQIWDDVEGGNQEWSIKRISEKAAAKAEEAAPAKKEKKAAESKEKGQEEVLKAINGSKTKASKSAKGSKASKKKAKK